MSGNVDERSHWRQFEERFFRQLRAQAEKLLKRPLPADRVRVEPTPDGIDHVRAELSRIGRPDRGLLDTLPGTRSEQLTFTKRFAGVMRTNVAKVRAQVLAPIESLAAAKPGTADAAEPKSGAPTVAGFTFPASGPPIGREQVLDALARYELLPRKERPTGVVFASATGFSPEALALVEQAGPPTVILLGGRSDGGWDLHLPQRMKNSPWARLVQLESEDERLGRLMYHLSKRPGELESRGVSVEALAGELGLSPDALEPLVRLACERDPRLMTVVHDGRVCIARTPFPVEAQAMNMTSWWSWFRRSVLRLPPTPAERVRELTAQRVQLEQQRAEIDTRLNALADEARKLEERGVGAKNDAERKTIAGQLMRTERELRRTQAQANMLTQQIDVIGTHIHHQTLAEQGKRVALPSAEELAKDAAQAESMMAELSTAADLASSIEVGATSPLMAEEEQAIMERFKAAAAEKAPPAASKAGASAESSQAAERSRTPSADRLQTGPTSEPPAGDKSKAKPELS